MKYIILVLSAMMFVGCDKDPLYHRDAKNESGDTMKYAAYTIYTIDDCQYIKYGSSFTHKGNCTNKIHIYNK